MKKKHRIGDWCEPKQHQILRDKEKIHHSGKRKSKACKFTKAEHDYKIVKFRIETTGKFRRSWRPDYKYFDLTMESRCGCGKKDWRNDI